MASMMRRAWRLCRSCGAPNVGLVRTPPRERRASLRLRALARDAMRSCAYGRGPTAEICPLASGSSAGRDGLQNRSFTFPDRSGPSPAPPGGLHAESLLVVTFQGISDTSPGSCDDGPSACEGLPRVCDLLQKVLLRLLIQLEGGDLLPRRQLNVSVSRSPHSFWRTRIWVRRICSAGSGPAGPPDLALHLVLEPRRCTPGQER